MLIDKVKKNATEEDLTTRTLKDFPVQLLGKNVFRN